MDLLMAEAMRRTRPRRAGARASLCHHLPEGSSAVIACKWRGKGWFTMILGLPSALAVSGCSSGLKTSMC